MLKEKRLAVLLFVCLCIFTLILGGCATEEKSARTKEEAPDVNVEKDVEKLETLTLVTGLPAPNPWHNGFYVFKEILEETSNLRINVLGGPEVIPSFDLMDAVSRGEVDLGLLPPIYTSDTVPLENGWDLIGTFGATPQQHRDMGVHDLRAAAYAEHNVYLAGTTGWGVPYYLWLKDPIEKADLSGKIIRGAPQYEEFLNYLGGDIVVMPSPEIYTAMERGVVDGFIWPGLGVYPMGWHEVTNYMVQPGFWDSGHFLIMNLDRWNAFSERQQQAFTEAMGKIEEQTYGIYDQLIKEELDLVLQKVKVIELPPEEAQKLKDFAKKAAEKVLLEKDPERGKALIELIEGYAKK